MSQWFEIRNAPKNEGGDVIAIWHCEKDDYELAFGVQNLEYFPDNEDDKRTYGRDDVGAISNTLVSKISEADFSVMSEIADIPQIVSDGVLHHLGVLTWCHIHWSGIDEGKITCKGNVYAKVVLGSGKWYQYEEGKLY